MRQQTHTYCGVVDSKGVSVVYAVLTKIQIGCIFVKRPRDTNRLIVFKEFENLFL